MVLNYTDIKYIEKITNSNIFFLWHQDDWMSESRFFLLNTLLIYFTRCIRCWLFLNVQYHSKHFKRNIYISYSILINELFIFIERELELEIKEKYRGDMQRRHPGTYSMQKQTTSSVPYYGMKKKLRKWTAGYKYKNQYLYLWPILVFDLLPIFMYREIKS